jgi:predicted DsbA family dithiol-disulfide isomerase
VRFDKARAAITESHPGVVIDVHYKPFMIDPGTQRDGEDYMAYNQRRWGSDGWTHSMRRMGAQEGAPYSNWKTWPNTTHCSRLLLLAEQHNMADRVIGLLYTYCYEQGKNVSLRETVAQAAVEAGVPGGKEYVMSDAGHAELRHELQSARINGKRVSAAPTFGIRVGHTVHDFSGAQDYEAWLSIFEQCAEIAAGHRH